MNSLYQFAQSLRLKGEILLNQELALDSLIERTEALNFLKEQYDLEMLEYPAISSQFQEKPASWAVRLMLYGGHYFLNREAYVADIAAHLPKMEARLSPEDQLSADLMLRFLPQLINEMKQLDTEDELIPLLENELRKSTFTSILYFEDFDVEKIKELSENKEMALLTLERVVAAKKWQWLKGNSLGQLLKEHIGIYSKEILELDNLDDIINGSN